MPPSPLARSGSPSQLGLGGSPSSQLSPGPPLVRFSAAGYASMSKASLMWPGCQRTTRLIGRGWPRLAEAGRGSGQPGGRSGAGRGLRSAGWPRSERAPCPHRYDSPTGERRLPRPASAAALVPPRPQAEYDRAAEGVRAEAERMAGHMSNSLVVRISHGEGGGGGGGRVTGQPATASGARAGRLQSRRFRCRMTLATQQSRWPSRCPSCMRSRRTPSSYRSPAGEPLPRP